jgi:hypothetical protein
MYNTYMTFLRKNLMLLILIVFVSLMPVVSVYAIVDPPCNPSGGKICNPIATDTITDFIENLLTNVIRIGIPIIALAVIYSGFLFVFARGNPEKITEAKSALLYTLIGAVLLLGSWAIAQLISETVSAL